MPIDIALTSSTPFLEGFVKLKMILGLLAPLLALNYSYGEGGLIHDESLWPALYLKQLRSALIFDKRIVICAIGAKKLGTYSKLISTCFNGDKVQWISVRDEPSKDALLQMGVRRHIIVTADPAALFYRKNQGIKKVGSEARLGINLRSWFDRMCHKPTDKIKLEFLLRNVVDILVSLSKLRSGSLKVVGLPFDLERDVRTLNRLSDLCPNTINLEILKPPSTPSGLINVMSSFDAFIGMRLHSLIFAAVTLVPFFSVSYAEKVKNFVKRLNWEKWSIDVETLALSKKAAHEAAEKLNELIEKRGQLSDLLNKRVTNYVKAAELNVKLIAKSLLD